jgi:hypothetical protein
MLRPISQESVNLSATSISYYNVRGGLVKSLSNFPGVVQGRTLGSGPSGCWFEPSLQALFRFADYVVDDFEDSAPPVTS